MKRFFGVCLAFVATLSGGATASAQQAGGGYSASASDQTQTLPRVNPRELLPRNWFGAAAPAQATPAAPSQGASSSQNASNVPDTGSARARLMRDVQRGDAAVAPSTEQRRAQARAGSVLSPNAPPTGAEAASAAAKNSRLARSIAVEAAEAISGSGATRPARTTQVLEEAATSTAPTGAPATEAPVIEPLQGAATPNDNGGISVATNPAPRTKLPMVIGAPALSAPTGTTLGASIAQTKKAAASGPQSAPVAKTTTAPGEPIEDDLLLTQRMPVLVSKVAGPRTITVGREALYRVLLANRGDIAADQVETIVTIPAHAELMGSKVSAGSVEPTSAPGKLVWKAQRLGAGEVVKLDLRLVARSGSPVELAVTHKHRPVDGRTLVEVQEPKLALSLVGPEEVLYGKPQTFRLTISNPGTGAAENVVLHLTPPGGDATKRTSHEFGAVGAGEERSVEIELTAREAGQLAINASANAEGGVNADVTKAILCRKPELAVDLRGPADRYAGSPTTYLLRVTNPGTATAPDVALEVELPQGFELLASAEAPEQKNGKLTYRVGALRDGEERTYELRGVLRQPGANTLVARAAASDETRSETVTTATEVVALADLKLDILDPQGPIATDQEVAYEIRITNRGSSDAHEIRVIGLFSEGIEPHHVEGAASKVNDGRVAFDTIDRLPAGEQLVFTIHARAYSEGTHLFRAEVLCRDLEIKLAAEETTRFYKDEAVSVAGEGYPTNPFSPR